MKNYASVEIAKMLIRLNALRSEINKLKEEKGNLERFRERLKKAFYDLCELKDSLERYQQLHARNRELIEHLSRSAAHRKTLSATIFRNYNTVTTHI
jgi:hypothetical protein